MLNVYETPRGDFAPASSLTTNEAVDLHQRGVLLAKNFHDLTNAAQVAICRRLEGRRNVVFLGVRVGASR